MPRWLLLTLPVLIAAAARASILLSTELMPGMNGAYYLVQARSLLQKGALAIPDLPLVFFLHASMAALLDWLTPLSQNEAVFVAVKTCDALPAAWAKSDRINLGIAILASILVPASAVALMMVGDFEKNSLGIALMCGLAWALHEWMNHPGPKRLILATVLLGLVGLTHIAVFGTALLLVASTLLVFAATQGRESWLRVARLGAVALPVALVAGAIVFWKFDPERVQKLLGAVSQPAVWMEASPFGGPSGLPAMGGPRLFPFLLNALAVGTAVTVAIQRRRTLPPGTVALITGAALTVVTLTGPWMQGDKVFRLLMNAAPLTWLCLLFTVLQIGQGWIRAAVGFPLFALLLTPSIFAIQEGGRPIITPEAREELRRLAAQIDAPSTTLIVARHGLEWWTAWTLGTHIAQPQALQPADWEHYRSVCFLEEKRIGMGGPGAGFGFGPPGGIGRDPKRGPGWFQDLLRPLLGMPGPPPGMGMGMRPGSPPDGRRVVRPGEPPMGGRPGPFEPGLGARGLRPGPGGGRMGGPMMGARIPEDAEILHDGEHYRLGRVHEPPPFVREGQTAQRK
jgi:hypothetical protein